MSEHIIEWKYQLPDGWWVWYAKPWANGSYISHRCRQGNTGYVGSAGRCTMCHDVPRYNVIMMALFFVNVKDVKLVGYAERP